jgi:hypothetical protein
MHTIAPSCSGLSPGATPATSSYQPSRWPCGSLWLFCLCCSTGMEYVCVVNSVSFAHEKPISVNTRCTTHNTLHYRYMPPEPKNKRTAAELKHMSPSTTQESARHSDHKEERGRKPSFNILVKTERERGNSFGSGSAHPSGAYVDKRLMRVQGKRFYEGIRQQQRNTSQHLGGRGSLLHTEMQSASASPGSVNRHLDTRDVERRISDSPGGVDSPSEVLAPAPALSPSVNSARALQANNVTAAPPPSGQITPPMESKALG